VRSDIAEAGDLGLLRRQVHDGVEDQVHDRERPVYLRRREVADRHADRLAARLGAQPGGHGPRQLDAMDRDAAMGQRQRDPAGANPQFQGPATAGKLGQYLDHRAHGSRLEHVGGLLVYRAAAARRSSRSRCPFAAPVRPTGRRLPLGRVGRPE
jgi:hypothetical protein